MQVEKVHDISTHLATEHPLDAYPRKGPIGVVNHRVARIIAFLLVSLAVIACAVVCILAIWQLVEPDYAWRSLSSLGIMSAAIAVFLCLNEGFGPAVHS